LSRAQPTEQKNTATLVNENEFTTNKLLYALKETSTAMTLMVDVTLEITRECSLNCLICSSNGGSRHPDELSLDKWLKVIDESIELGAESFSLSGGEPFSHPYFREICKYISKRGLSLSIYTCGNVLKNGKLTCLEREDIKFVSDLGPVRLVFSLQGANSGTHDSITCIQGSFRNTVSSISCTVERGLPAETHFVPVSPNYRELPDLVTLSKNLGARKLSVLRFVAQGRGRINERLLELKNNDLACLGSMLMDMTRSSSFVRVGVPFSPLGTTKLYHCTAGIDRMTIRFDGLVVPCEAMKFMAEDYEDNSVRRSSLGRIWRESEIFRQARQFQTLIAQSDCNSCSFFHKCRGGCPAQRSREKKVNECVDPMCMILGAIIYEQH
jgi:radical SAM protein with 4Fe4S-binding SPASM domain